MKLFTIMLFLCAVSFTGRAEISIRTTGEVKVAAIHYYAEAPVLMDPLRDSGGTTGLAAFVFIWRSNGNGFRLIEFRIGQLSDEQKFYFPLKDGDWIHVTSHLCGGSDFPNEWHQAFWDDPDSILVSEFFRRMFEVSAAAEQDEGGNGEHHGAEEDPEQFEPER